VIGYLISPKIVCLPTIYNEGDIIIETLVIEEELLIPDKVSTRLKMEKLIQDQRLVYECTPSVPKKSESDSTSLRGYPIEFSRMIANYYK